MEQSEECICNRMTTDFYELQFIITGTQIELQCNRSNGLIEWWHDLATKNEVPFRRVWSYEERLAMR
jgi:hypothetical protein